MHLARRAFKAMGSPCELHIYAADAKAARAVLRDAIAEVERLERKYSRYRDDSLLSRINHSAGDAAGITVDAETAALLDYAAVCHEQSAGLFDITSGVLRRVWDFKSNRVPAQAEIDTVLPLVGWQRLCWRRPHLVLPLEGMELDLGGIVKEYAVDSLLRLARQAGIRHGLIDLGGDIGVIGPHPDGSSWRIGIRNPWCGEEAAAVIELAGGGLATSGDYERHMVVDGVRYGHILDPLSGWPVRDSAVSISVVADQCVVAGAAATTAMLKDDRARAAWLDELGLSHLCIERDGGLTGTVAAAAVS